MKRAECLATGTLAAGEVLLPACLVLFADAERTFHLDRMKQMRRSQGDSGHPRL